LTASQLAKNPSHLDDSDRERARTGTDRPRPVAFSGASGAQVERLFWNGHKQRTLKAQSNRPIGFEVSADCLDQIDDFASAAVSLDLGCCRIAARPAEAVPRYRADVSAVNDYVHDRGTIRADRSEWLAA
jgi:hypothetical protein